MSPLGTADIPPPPPPFTTAPLHVEALDARAHSESEIEKGLDTLTEELRAARRRYERTRALDEALFGKDYAA